VNLLPSSDHIIALGSDGTIVEQGTFQQLNAAKGYVHSFCIDHAADKSVEGEEDETNRATKSTYRPGKLQDASKMALHGKKRQIGDWSVYRYYFSTLGWKMTCVFFFLQIFYAFFSTFPSEYILFIFMDSL
jgi:ATP-binding cassette subfamily C (CFTR/MRP) protein 1